MVRPSFVIIKFILFIKEKFFFLKFFFQVQISLKIENNNIKEKKMRSNWLKDCLIFILTQQYVYSYFLDYNSFSNTANASGTVIKMEGGQ